MTTLVVSIMPTNSAELTSCATRAWASGAAAIEVRIDNFADDPDTLAAYLKNEPDRTWIVTCRIAAEGGHFHGDADARVARLSAVADGADAYIDFEFADWQQRPDLRNDVLRVAATAEGGHRLILSAHDYGATASNPDSCSPLGNLGSASEATTKRADLIPLFRRMREVPNATVAKIAYHTDDICDTFDALDWMHEHGDAVTAIAMGEVGLWTRVLARKFGAFSTYCALDDDATTAPGQLSLDEMIHLYRWRAINTSTKVFGVIGDPVAHSMSPFLHNRWFAEAKVNAVYIPLRVTDRGDGLQRFLTGCRDRPWLDVGGFSVTTPHKTAALHAVGDGADPTAKRIQAVNTLQFSQGDVRGYNTDADAAVASLVEALGCERSDLAGASVDVLGSGGAAKAVLHGLHECGCRLTIYGRSNEKTRRLAEEFRAIPTAWENRVNRNGEVLINCTSVGMWPEIDASPMPDASLQGCRLVFDLIYNPLRTRLLRDASEVGADTLNGLDMFVRQAAMQFERWMGLTPDTDRAKKQLRRQLDRRFQTGQRHPIDRYSDPKPGPA